VAVGVYDDFGGVGVEMGMERFVCGFQGSRCQNPTCRVVSVLPIYSLWVSIIAESMTTILLYLKKCGQSN
jgi:hypothetical protein